METMIERLKAPFPADQIHWRPGSTTKDKKKCMPLAYINARDVMDRLDEVMGYENWQSKHEISNDGAQCICSIGIYFGDGWVWKSDGAGKSDIEGEKGMISDALKRAAVSWGIGRYLYNLPVQWVEMDQYKKIVGTPKLPGWALPGKQSPTETNLKQLRDKEDGVSRETSEPKDDHTLAIKVLCEKLGRDFDSALAYMVGEGVDPKELRSQLEAALRKKNGK